MLNNFLKTVYAFFGNRTRYWSAATRSPGISAIRPPVVATVVGTVPPWWPDLVGGSIASVPPPGAAVRCP